MFFWGLKLEGVLLFNEYLLFLGDKKIYLIYKIKSDYRALIVENVNYTGG